MVICKEGRLNCLNMYSNETNGKAYHMSCEKPQIKTDKPPKVRERVSDFADYTSTHGVPHIKRTSLLPHKIFWLIAVLCMTGGLLFQIISIIQKYLDNPYTVLVDVKFDRNIRFPGVTICNANAVRLSQLPDLVQSFDDYGEYDWDWIGLESESLNTTSAPGDNDETGGNGTTASYDTDNDDEGYNYDTPYENPDDFWDQQDYSYNWNDTEDDEVQLLEQQIHNLDTLTKIAAGHQLSNMLLRCSFQGSRCGVRNFTLSHNPKFGNCYTFNGPNTREFQTASRPGEQHGLTLELLVEVHEYITQLTESAGMVVSLHDQNSIPIPEEQGLMVSPGLLTHIGIKRFEVSRLGDPYYPCWPSSTAGKKNIYSHRFPNSYDYSICLRSCYQHKVASSCDCGDSDFPLDNPDLKDGHLDACLSRNTEQAACRHRVHEDFLSGRLECDCEIACNEVHFIANPSSSVWPIPTNTARANVIQSYRNEGHPGIISLINDLQGSDQTDVIGNNIVKLKIFYEDLNYEKIYQTPAYNETDVISDIGGNMGIFVGMSLLTVIEYFEFIGYIIYTCCLKMKRRNKLKNYPIK